MHRCGSWRAARAACCAAPIDGAKKSRVAARRLQHQDSKLAIRPCFSQPRLISKGLRATPAAPSKSSGRSVCSE
eukprot:5930399-Lingulodinium_polyedra.AAC.1